MVFAEISATSAYLCTALGLACAATVIAFLVGLGLTLRRSTRKIGQQVLFVATASVAVDLGLAIIVAMLDAS